MTLRAIFNASWRGTVTVFVTTTRRHGQLPAPGRFR